MPGRISSSAPSPALAGEGRGGGPSARELLRQATAATHQRLHHVPAFAAMAVGSLTREDYAAVLRRLASFHAGVEAALAQAPSLAVFGVAVAERRRSPLLLADLQELGAPTSGPAVVLPPLHTAAAAMGCVYVVEGSTLGGQQLARGLPVGWPRRFLLGHGAAHGAMWRDFVLALERCGADPARLAEMIDGAQTTFASFEAWFDQAGSISVR